MEAIIPLVIFDCDGVLVNSEEVAYPAQRQCKERHGLVFTDEEYQSIFSGLTYEEYFKALEKQFQLKLGITTPVGIIDEIKKAHEEALEQRMQTIEGVGDFIRSLTLSNIFKCVASNGNMQGIEYRLNKTGLRSEFGAFVFSKDMVAAPKPAPDLFLHAMQQMGFTDPARCIVIEDSPPGVQAGRAAGMYVIGFAGGTHRPPGYDTVLAAAGADVTAYTMDKVSALAFQRMAALRNYGVAPRPCGP